MKIPLKRQNKLLNFNSNRKPTPQVSHFNSIVEHYDLLLNEKPYGRNNQKRFVREILRNLRRYRVDGIVHFDYDESRKISSEVKFANFPIHVYEIIFKAILNKKPTK